MPLPDQPTDADRSSVAPTDFPHLFSPLRIGNVEVKNRILSSGHDTVMAHDGQVTDQLIAYHEARAAGGVGLIVMQVVGVHETARYTSHVLMATDDEGIAGYQRLSDAVHAHDTKLFAQLFHPGREIMESQDGSSPVALAPSAVPSERFRVMPRAMTGALIDEVVAGYADAAARLRQSGIDGVEVVASHGYLPAQFLNPHVNRRDDEYGGSFDNRLRFLRRVVEAIRTAVGSDFVVGVRVSGDEMTELGLGSAETAEVCAALDELGTLDYVSVCAGSSATLAGSDHIAPPMTQANGYTAALAATIRKVMSVPVMVAGRINQPQEAEQILADGSADACAMTRALICDPDMPAKAATGRAEEIRACIACNQACIGHFQAGYPISCIQRPETGRERVYGIRTLAATRRRILVAGAGPAGLKAAVVAAERGHDVTVYESARHPGGQVLLAQSLPGRAEFGGAVTNLLSEADRAGVRVVTGTRVDLELVRSERPDAVVVATGAEPYRPELELTAEMPAVDAWQVIQGETLPRGKVVVADWRSDWTGLGVALLLAERGHRVVLAVAGYQPGELLQQYVRDAMVRAAYQARIEILPLVRPYGADDDTVYLQHVLTGEPVLVDGIAGLVLAQGHTSVDHLLADLADDPVELHGIGDCLAPRSVEEAVLEGLKTGAAL